MLLGIIAVPTRKLDFVVEGFLAAAAPEQVERLIDGNPIYPTEKFELWIIFVEPFSDLEKYRLRDVLGILRPPQHPEGRVVDRPLVPNYELREGCPIALSAAFDQRPISVIIH